MSKVILELDDAEIVTGYVTATKIDEKGQRKGKMPLQAVADLFGQVFDLEAESRRVSMVTRFAQTEMIAFGANGPKWQAIKEIQPADYYLVSATEKAYKVHLPRLVIFVGNYIRWPRLFWTPDAELTTDSKLYPLIIGNTYNDGRVCTGNTGLKCRTPDEIDTYVRRLIESPATHTVTKHTDRMYKALEKRWAPGIGRKHGIPLAKLLAVTD